MSIFKKLLFSFFCGLFFNASTVEWVQNMAGAENFFVKDDFNEESLCPLPKKLDQDLGINEFSDSSYHEKTDDADAQSKMRDEVEAKVRALLQHHKKNNLVYCPKAHFEAIKKKTEELIQSKQYRSSNHQYELLRECFIAQISKEGFSDSGGKLIEEQLRINYLPELWASLDGVFGQQEFKKTDPQKLKKYFESICTNFFSSKKMQDAFTIARLQKKFTSLNTHQLPKEFFQNLIRKTPKPKN